MLKTITFAQKDRYSNVLCLFEKHVLVKTSTVAMSDVYRFS